MTNTNYNKVEFRIVLMILIAAFIGSSKTLYSTIFVLILELSIIQIIFAIHFKDIKVNFRLVNKHHKVILLLLILSFTVSSLILTFEKWGGEQLPIGLTRYLSIVLHISFILVLSLYFVTNQPKRNIFTLLPVSIAFASLVIFLDYHFNSNSVMGNNSTRVIIAYNIRNLGHITMLGCLYCVISIVLLREEQKKRIFSLLFIINFSLLLWLGGRGAIIAFFIASLASILIIQRNFIEKIKHTSYLISLMIVSCLVSLPFNIYDWNGINRFVQLSQTPNITIEKFSNSRFSLWTESIGLIIEKPWWGHGPEAHKFLTEIGFLQPHNFILQFLLEFGIVGFSFFILVLYYILKISFINAQSACNINNLFCFSLITSIIIHSLYSGSLYHAAPVVLLSIASAYVYYVYLNSLKQATS